MASGNDLSLQEEAEYQESERRRRNKELGIREPSKTNFPNKGENKKISLANSEYQEFPYNLAEKIMKTRKDIWRLGISSSSTPLKTWSYAKDGSEEKKVLSWIKRRENYAKKNVSKKLTPSLVVSLIKYGLVHTSGVTTMMKVLGLNSSGSIDLRSETEAGKESGG